ncbi:MAG: CoA ester lyase [Desulfobacteraceae bacterium]|nr:CoA ester lyase [Desulfobacteraceae bacterium]
MADIRIWRSLLFIPANSWKMLNKAATEMEDGVIIDLEDACPVAERETGRIFARDITPILKTKEINVLVRVNSLPTGATADDLRRVVTEGLDGIMLPKSESKEDILTLAELLDREEERKGIKYRIKILPLIESPKGVINAYEIGTASERVAALGFGAGDFTRELGEGFTIAKLTPDEYFPVLLHARSTIATAACAIGILAIDTPYFGLLIDIEGLERETSKAKLLGFKGKMLTHPRHVETVNRVFSPSPEDIEFSQRLVDAYKEAEAQGKGAAVLDGRMIDIAMYKMGMHMISKADGIANKAKLRATTDSDSIWIPGR